MADEVFHVLVVDDDMGDVRLMQEAIKDAKLHIEIHEASNGREALDFLRKKESYADVPRPHLILLDLNMPVMSGREALAEIKADKALKTIPVVILTTSSADADVAQTYDLGANCFVTKPVGFEEFKKVIREIEEFWFTVVRRPESSDKS